MGNRPLKRLLLPLVVVVTVVAAACSPAPPAGGADTAAPILTITNRQDGDTVDGSRGQLQLLEGLATDLGSGVASVTLTAPDGSSVVAALDPSGSWSAPIGAPVSGVATFKVKAVDKAGNATEKSIGLSMIALPTTAGTVVRPSTLQLTAGLQTALSSLTATTLVFNGNLTTAFQGFTTVLSGPIGVLAPDGFIRSMESVSFNAATNKTTVVTIDAGLVDAFAQFDYVAPPTDVTDPPAVQGPLGLAQLSTTSKCDDFVQNSTVKVKATASYSLGLQGQLVDSSVGAAVTTSVKVAFKANVNVKVKVGWTGAKVSGSISSGMMVCGSAQVLAKINFKKDIPFFKKSIPAGTILGVGISLVPSAGLRFEANAEGSLPATEYYAGIDVNYTIGSSPNVTYPHGASTVGGGTTASVLLGGYASMDLGLGIAGQNGAELGLIDAGLGYKMDFGTDTVEGCLNFTGDFAPSLKLQIPNTKFKVTVFSFKLGLEFSAACTELWNRANTPVDLGPVSTATAIDVPELLAGQRAQWTLNGTAGQVVNLSGYFQQPADGICMYVYILKADGTELKNNLACGGVATVRATLPTSGQYFLQIRNSDDRTRPAGDFGMSFGPDVNLGVVSTATAVSVPALVAGQRAQWTLNGTAGQVVNLSGYFQQPADGICLFVYILKADGTELRNALTCSAGDVATARLTLPTSGQYFLQIENTDNRTRPAGDFGMSFGPDVNLGVVSTATAVSVPALVAGQRAQWTLNGTAGQVVNLSGYFQQPADGICLFVYILKADGTELRNALTCSAGAGATARLTLPATGQYFLQIENTDNRTRPAGDFGMSFGPDVALGPLPVGSTATPTILPYQQVYWTVARTAGQSIALTATPTAGTGSFYVRIVNPSGTTVTTSGAPVGSPVVVNYTTTASGTYQISLENRSSAAFPAGAISLQRT